MLKFTTILPLTSVSAQNARVQSRAIDTDHIPSSFVESDAPGPAPAPAAAPAPPPDANTTTTAQTTPKFKDPNNYVVNTTAAYGSAANDTAINANGTFTQAQWESWNETRSNTNVTTGSNMYTIMTDYMQQLHTIGLELSRQNTNYARYQGMATDLYRETLDNKKALGYQANTVYGDIVNHMRAAKLSQGILNIAQSIDQVASLQYMHLFRPDGSWQDVAVAMNLQQRSFLYQERLIEDQRTAMVKAKSLYDSWIQSTYQDSMLNSTGSVIGQNSNQTTNTQKRQELEKEANGWLNNVTNMATYFPSTGPSQSCNGTAACAKAGFTNTGNAGASSLLDEQWTHDDVVKQTIENVKNHPMSLLHLEDRHFQKHGQFAQHLNPSLKKTVYTMIDDAHKLKQRWTRIHEKGSEL